MAVLTVAPVMAADAPGGRLTTCSGDTVMPVAQDYFFALTKQDGFCMTSPFYANTYGEARECARVVCPDCRAEDITKDYILGWVKPGNPGFCPARVR